MEAVDHRRDSWNCCRLAPRRLSHVLEADLPSPGTGWAKADAEGGAGVNLPHGGGEPHLGSATHPWGTADARVGHLGTDDLPLDETSAEGRRAR